MADEHDRLVRAVERSLLPALARHGFRLGQVATGARGSSVALLGDGVRINVVADWLEGDVGVDLEPTGEPTVEIIRLSRLPRSLGVGS